MRKLAIAMLCTALGLTLDACAGMEGLPGVSKPETTDVQGYGNYLSARLAANNHDLLNASRLYRASLDSAPDNADLLGHAFLYTATAGQVDDAVSLAKRVLVSDPDNRAARLAIAVSALKHGDYAGARTQMAQSAKGPFTTLTLLLLDAWAAAGAGDTKAALADLAQVPKEGGTDVLANFHRALVLDLAGDNGDANTAYRAVLSTGSGSPRIADAYGRFLERSGQLDDARALYTKLQSDAAISPVATAGLERLRTGRKPDRLVASAADGGAEALFGIAASLSDETSADIAVLYLRFALYLSPGHELAKIVLADRFEALGKTGDAIAVYRTVNLDSPYGPAAAVQVALDESRLGNNERAIADLDALVKVRPDDVTAWTALGDVYRSTEKFSDAATAYDHAVDLSTPPNAKDWPLFYARAMAEGQSKRWDTAEQDLQRALKLSPDQPQVLNYLGYSWVDQGRRLPEALAMLEKARTLSPFDGYIVDSVGWAYYRLGRYEEATKSLENAILLVPGDSTINEHLGDAYWKIGRKLDAHFQWSHALAFGADAAAKANLEKKLQDGLDSGADRP